MATVKPDTDSREWIEPVPASMERVADAIFRQADNQPERSKSDSEKATERQER